MIAQCHHIHIYSIAVDVHDGVRLHLNGKCSALDEISALTVTFLPGSQEGLTSPSSMQVCYSCWVQGQMSPTVHFLSPHTGRQLDTTYDLVPCGISDTDSALLDTIRGHKISYLNLVPLAHDHVQCLCSDGFHIFVLSVKGLGQSIDPLDSSCLYTFTIPTGVRYFSSHIIPTENGTSLRGIIVIESFEESYLLAGVMADEDDKQEKTVIKWHLERVQRFWCEYDPEDFNGSYAILPFTPSFPPGHIHTSQKEVRDAISSTVMLIDLHSIRTPQSEFYCSGDAYFTILCISCMLAFHFSPYHLCDQSLLSL